MLEGAVAHSAATIRLVINADGFGASAARNAGVLSAHRNGIVTSTSVLGNAGQPVEVLAELKAMPKLGTGVLLALADGPAVARPDDVPSLVDPEGRFPPRGRDVVLAWGKAAVRGEDVEREFDAQIARWRDAGLVIDHLAIKDNLGSLPMVALAAEKVARKHGIAGLRTVVEKPTLAWTADVPRGLAVAAAGALAWYSRRHLGVLRHGPQTWGHFDWDRLDEIRLLEIVGRLGPGGHEILCAPDHRPEVASPPRQDEVAALCSPRVAAAIGGRGIELCRWSDLF